MKRAIVKFIDGEHCNIEGDSIDFDNVWVSIHLGGEIVGMFRLENINCVYISEKK